MKKTHITRFCAILLTLALAFTTAACFEKEPAEPEAQTVPTVTDAPKAEEPGIDEVAFGGSAQTNEAPQPPVDAPENAPQAEQPAENVPETIETAEAPESVPQAPAAPGADLTDGRYTVFVHRDLSVDGDGFSWATIGLVIYEEHSDAQIAAIKLGDTVQLHNYSFDVDTLETVEENGVRVKLFNEGTERCFYMAQTNTWRFAWPGGEYYTYEGQQFTLRVAVDATLTDELTPRAEGQNIYGVENDGSDGTIGFLDSIQDFFAHYGSIDSERATVTVRNGEIASVVFEYHP